MKTVSQLAAELGVSVQTVYRRVKQYEFEGLTVKQAGKLYFTEKGEEILRESLTPGQQMLNSVKQNVEEKSLELRQLYALVEQLKEELATERKYNREQGAQVIALAGQLAELTRNSQLLLGAEQQRKRSLWAWLSLRR